MFDRIRDFFSPSPSQAKAGRTPHRRGYAAANLTRTLDFMTMLEVAHKERQRDLPRLRAHSRDLKNNNVYAARAPRASRKPPGTPASRPNSQRFPSPARSMG